MILLGFCRPLGVEARVNLNDFSTEYSFKVVKVSIQTSLKQNKPLQMERSEFDYRDEETIVSLFGVYSI